jgi:hypothetical protein
MLTWKGSLVALAVGQIAEALFEAPGRLPDIYVLWNVTVCWACFSIYWGWLVWWFWGGEVMLFLNRRAKKEN